MRTTRKNPELGTHPDLFESGETPIFVPLSEVPADKLAKLPAKSFTSKEWDKLTPAVRREILGRESITQLMEDDVWNNLGAKDQEFVLERSDRDEVLGNGDVLDNLTEDEVTFFVEVNDDSQEHIEKLVKVFKDKYEEATNPEFGNYVTEYTDDELDQWLQENADHLVDIAEDRRDYKEEINEIVEAHEGEGYSRDQIRQAIDEAMRDTSNYQAKEHTHYDGFYVASYYAGYITIDHDDVKDIGLYPQELRVAIDEIHRVTDGIFDRGGLSRNLRPERYSVIEKLFEDRNFTLERDVECNLRVDYNPDWTAIADSVVNILADVTPDEGGEGVDTPETAIEDRIVYRFKDGYFVVELLPKEFVAEGAPYECAEHGQFYPGDGDIYGTSKTAPCPKCRQQSPRAEGSLFHCIGSPQQRFYRAAKRGEGKAWSLRTPSGKRKIAIFADLKSDGSIRRIDQAKGYRNRLPGCEASVAGGAGCEGKIKPEEIEKVAEFISFLGIDPLDVGDLGPGVRKVEEKAAEGNRESAKVVQKLASISPKFTEYLASRVKSNPAGRPHVARWRAVAPTKRGTCRHCGGERGGFCG